MKIEKVVIENFRGWSGNHEIEFSTDAKKPVTLIIAENGTGKSNLLEAIMWCLHGIFPDNSDKPHIKINTFAKRKNKNTVATVRLFVVDDKESVLTKEKNPRYEISRQIKSNDEEPEAVVYELTNNYNQPKIYSKPRLIIDKLIPERLLKFFIFSGEGIEQLFKSSEEDLLRQAVDDMQGLTYARQALSDIESFRDQLLAELSSNDKATNDAKKAQKNYDAYDQKKTQCNEQINVLAKEKKDNILRLKEIKDLIRDSGIQDIEALEAQRDILKSNIDSLIAQKVVSISNLNRLMNDNAATILLKDTLESINTFLTEDSFKSKYPKRYQDEFVDDLLDEPLICICGREFQEHSDEWNKINNLRAYAGNDLQMENHEKVQRFKGSFTAKNRSFRNGFSQLEENISGLESQLAMENKAYTDIKRKIEKKGKKTNIEGLITEEENKENRNLRIDEESATLKIEVKNYVQKMKDEKKKIDAGTVGVDSELVTRKDFIQDCWENFNIAIDETQREGRSKLLDKLNQLAEKYDTKGQYFKYLNENSYTPLFLEQGQDFEDPSNTGNTIMKTLFYSLSLIQICIERYLDEKTIIQPGTIAPMICDAAFSDLSQSNSRTAAELLTSIPEQTVILINAESYQGRFSEVLKKKSVVGKSYLFQRNQQVKVDKDISEIEFNSKKYQAFIYNEDLVSNTSVPIKF